ncbi:ribosome hibernation promoting factor [Photobacterium aquimaris]|uniref:Ribosome hibernation promoting factor n=1 Tax=Photobacterium aquimaris TaxID=512643 RepID=A0A2T3I158_9GAMM|nr:ribosome hibernation promoting factor [Photobacterium aquimaris]MCP4957297.1 ribosome hibernation promoting factor [Photobacterium aquimaris]OBU26197.1 ribosomal subunit interface protein [Photobacterium aquimaris]PQJ42042.1 ribosomal subunit interface protein [Photobacterium aquimaris]PSU10226.1 ribosome hibernation promoting factor [Photobacterium aquimaris]
MQINITGHHVDVTDSLREYVSTKFEKLERFFDKINNVQVILNIEKMQQIAEATLHINAGEIHAKADSENMYAAIDELTDKLVRQLNKHKDKLNSH